MLGVPSVCTPPPLGQHGWLCQRKAAHHPREREPGGGDQEEESVVCLWWEGELNPLKAPAPPDIQDVPPSPARPPNPLPLWLEM